MDILLVDDDPHIRKAVVRILKGLGHEVAEASSGQMALDILEVELVQVLITDFQMPGMNGLELIAKVRAKFPQLKVIITSGGGLNSSDVPPEVTCLPKPVSQADWEKHLKETL